MAIYGTGRQAVVRYHTPDFEVLSPGDHVLCAVTGMKIPLDDLKYWSVARQEAYVDAAASTRAEIAWREKQGLPA